MPPCSRSLCVVVNYLLVFLVITPLGTTFWAVTWELLDEYILPDNLLLRATISIASGSFICTTLNCLLPYLRRIYTLAKRPVTYNVLTRVFTYVFACGNISLWWGVSNLFDDYTGTDWEPSLLVLCVSYLWLVILRASKTMQGPPLGVTSDDHHDFFVSLPRFRNTKTLWYCLDHVFSLVFVTIPGIIAWRSWWSLLDDWVFPGYPVLSNQLTALVGGVATFVMVMLSPSAAALSATLDSRPLVYKLIFEDGYFLLANLANIASQRGVWNLVVIGIQEDKVPWALFLHTMCYLGLVALMSSGSLYNKNIDVDGEEMCGRGVQFNMDWLDICEGVIPLQDEGYC